MSNFPVLLSCTPGTKESSLVLICMIAFASSALCEGVYLLQSGGQVVEDALTSSLPAKLMRIFCNKFGRNITGFRPVIDLAFMRDVVNKLSSNSKKINPLVNLEFRGRVVFNADSVLGTDSCTSMNSQVTKPGNIAEDSSIISAHEHVKTSHGSFIHPQGSKELVGSLETEWKTTNQYLLKEHAWLRCTRRCMFALVPQLNNLLRKLDILSLHTTEDPAVMPQTRNSIENTPTTDTGLLSNLHVFLLVHNSHPPPCRLNCMRQQKVLQHENSTDCVEYSVLTILSLEGYDFLEAIRPREITATAQLPGTTSIHVQMFNIELKAKMKSYHMPEYDSTLRVKQLVNAVSEKVIRAEIDCSASQFCDSSVATKFDNQHPFFSTMQNASLLKVSPSHVGYYWQSGKPTRKKSFYSLDLLEMLRHFWRTNSILTNVLKGEGVSLGVYLSKSEAFFNINILPVGNIYGFKVFSSKKFSLHICISDSEPAKMFDSARNLVEILLDFNLCSEVALTNSESSRLYVLYTRKKKGSVQNQQIKFIGSVQNQPIKLMALGHPIQSFADKWYVVRRSILKDMGNIRDQQFGSLDLVRSAYLGLQCLLKRVPILRVDAKEALVYEVTLGLSEQVGDSLPLVVSFWLHYLFV
ncbi:hypothetical protein LguiB_026844 [Lonicera macranthoides]